MKVVIGLIAAVGLVSCDKPAAPVESSFPAAEAPATIPTPQPLATPAPDTRVAAMQLMCGGESFRVAFEEVRAAVVGADGGNTELARLEAQPDSAPGVAVYTNGMITFTKEGGRDTATVIRYAKGRMAFQDCAIAQH